MADSDPPSNPGIASPSEQSEADILVVLQSKKAELLHKRDALAAKKSHLLQTTQRLSLTLEHYKQQEAQYETRQKLEYYLNQNDREFARLSGPDDAASFVLENLHVLPSTNAEARRKLMAKFYPNVSVKNPSIQTVHKDGILLKVINYTLEALGVPSLELSVFVRDEAVHSIEICNLPEIQFLLRKLSPSFSQCLVSNYVVSKKVDLIMYSYHSLAQLQQTRTSTLAEILHKFPELVTKPETSWSENPTVSLSLLKLIELCVTEPTTGRKFYVRLQWDIAMANSALGDLESDLRLTIANEKGDTLKDPTDVFLNLVSEHGVVKAFVLVVKNIFGI